MSDLDKILITTAATILGGVSVVVLGQVLSKFLIEPIYEQRKTVGAISDALIYYAHHFADSVDRPFAEVSEASDTFRRLASELMARTVAIPGYLFWGRVRFIRPYTDIDRARGGLIGLSNSLHRKDFQQKVALARDTARALGIAAVDYGLLGTPEEPGP